MAMIPCKNLWPYSPSKHVLREEETSWFIKRPSECKLTNIGHFKNIYRCDLSIFASFFFTSNEIGEWKV
jgi:hypothetical protein